jgi:hypothetical protein
MIHSSESHVQSLLPPSREVPICYIEREGREVWGRGRLLADEEHIDSAEVEIVKEGKSSEAIICRMLTSIELQNADKLVYAVKSTRGSNSYHHSFSFVLDDVA